MSVTPTPALPVVPAGGTPDAGTTAAGPAASGFAALMAALLLPGAAVDPKPGAPTGAPVDAETDAEPTEQTGSDHPDLTVAPQGVPGQPIPAGPVVQARVAPAPVTGGSEAPVTGGPESPVAAASGGPTGTDVAATTTVVAEPEQPAPHATSETAPTAEVATRGPAGGERPEPTPARDPSPVPPVTSQTAPERTPTETGPAAPQPSSAAVTAPSAAGSPLSTTPAPAGTSPEPAAAVTRQVLPELTRLVSRGDGTHRLTMTLQPEALGEVRVTLTVRNGEVQVRLAAGEEARAALLEGAPELRRVLELAGATETRVLVRDLAGPVSGQSSPTFGDAPRGDTGATGHGRHDTDHHDAGTRRGTTARDGASDGTRASRPEPVVSTRSAGVDLTM